MNDLTVKGVPIEQFYLKQATKVMLGILKDMLKEAEFLSPTDTGKYKSSWKINPPKTLLSSLVVIASIENTSGVRWIIETGVLGKTYNYHDGPPRIEATIKYTGIGNKTAQRTLDKFAKIFNDKLRGIG